MRRPRNSTRPLVGPYSPTMRRATVDLPQPDSPTSASVSPPTTSKLTSSTARRLRRGSRSMTRFSHGAETSKSRLTRERLRRLGGGMQPAGRGARARGQQLGALDGATLEPPRAAWVERAAGRNGVQARHGALDLGETPVALRCDLGNRAHQAGGVGVA